MHSVTGPITGTRHAGDVGGWEPGKDMSSTEANDGAGCRTGTATGGDSVGRDIVVAASPADPASPASESSPLLGDAGSTPSHGAGQERRSVWVEEKEPSIGLGRGTCIVLSVWALLFLPSANMSGTATIQSQLAADLDAYGSRAVWFTSAYLTAFASLAPVVSRLASIFSPSTLVLLESLVFAAGCLVCARAASFAVFVAGRVVQGAAAGGIVTLALCLALELTSKKRRGLFIGLVNVGMTTGLSAGAVVFGLLLPAIGWRPLFWGQAVIALAAGSSVYLCLLPVSTVGSQQQQGKTVSQRLAAIDYAGAVVLTTSIVLLLLGLSSTIQPVLLLLSFATLLLFLFVETHVASDPLLSPAVLFNRGVFLACLAQLGLMSVRWTVLFYAPVFVMAVWAAPPSVAGAVLIPTNVGFGLGGLLAGALHVRRAGDFWAGALAACAAFSAAMLALSALIGRETAATATATAAPAAYAAVIFANGLCTGAAMTYTLAHVLHLAPAETQLVATGLLATFRSFSGSFGTAIGGGVFSRALRAALEDGFARLDGAAAAGSRDRMIAVLVGSPAAVHQEGFLTAAEREVAVAGYEQALQFLYRGGAALCLVVLAVQAGTGWTAPRRKKEEAPVGEGLVDESVERRREEA